MKNGSKFRRRAAASRAQDDGPGHDAFLDIVANLVGILIILVVVVGAHAGASIGKDASEAYRAKHDKIDSLKNELELAQQKADSLYLDSLRLDGITNDEKKLRQITERERQSLLNELNQLEEQKLKLVSQRETGQQDRLKLAQRHDALRSELEQLEETLEIVESELESKRRTITHYPTPIAKTVFQDEVHYRLKEGRIVFVPLDKLVDKMRAEWQLKAERLKKAAKTVETVGPAGPFRLQYTLEAVEKPVKTQIGVVQERSVEFRQFVVLPTREPLGEPLDEALKEGSQFKRRLAKLKPGRATISVWVYPDSYRQFNTLKRFLRESGFQTAVWPLAEGKLISGGPNGYRSTAQ